MAFRVTQRMMTASSLGHLQQGLNRSAKLQEQLSTGRVLNRPSDNPTDATAAMRLRDTIADNKQFVRNAKDGMGWLGQIDTMLQQMTTQVRKARDLSLQGANDGAMGPAARDALATEIDQIRAGLLDAANTKYLDRPIFGGVTSGGVAYDANGDYVGTTAGEVTRRVADGVTVRVDTRGDEIFGIDGDTNLFGDLAKLADDLRAGNTTGVRAGIDKLDARMDQITAALSDVGARYNRVEYAHGQANSADLDLSTNLSGLENVDLAEAAVEVKIAEVAYQASLAATSRVLQPSLLDFLR